MYSPLLFSIECILTCIQLCKGMHLYQLNYKIGEFARSHKMSSFISCTFPLFADFAVSPNNSKLWRINHNFRARQRQLECAVANSDFLFEKKCHSLEQHHFVVILLQNLYLMFFCRNGLTWINLKIKSHTYINILLY